MSSRSSKTDRAAGRSSADPAARTVVIGRVRRPHGLRGDLLVEVLSDVPDRLKVGLEPWLVDVAGHREAVRIEHCRPHGGDVLIQLAGREDRDAVEDLRGATFELDRSEVPPAPEGSWYFFELVGCSCTDRHLGDLGVVREILLDGGGHLLRLDDGRREVLVPFVRAYLERVDLEAERIELNLPEGLVETCASPS